MSLAAIVALLAVMTDPADARRRGKRGVAKRAAAVASYTPPYAAIVVDAKTGAVLHQSAPDGARHPASLTKIMTLYLLFERMEAGKIALDTEMDVSAEAASQAPTKLGLRPGSTLRVEDAIKGLVTKSANDAAVVVAEALGGSESEFAKLMTRKAQAIGMRNTVYRNASGLPNDEQITTARDQALLGIAIQERFPKYYRYFSISSFVYHGSAMRNHNKLLGKVEGVDGIKTGYTNASGFNLVTSVKRGYRHIVAVVLGGRSGNSRDARMRELIAANISSAAAKPPTAVASDGPKAPSFLPPLPPIPPLLAKPEPVVTPEPAAPELASAESRPVPAPGPRTPEATATIPGSDAPIKPVKVKTLAVKLVPPKDGPAPAAGSAPEVTKSVRTASLAPPQEEAPRSDTVVAPVMPRSPVVGKQPPAALAKDAAPPSRKDEARIPSRPTNTRGGWAIQVGAYEDEGEAKEKVGAAKGKVSAIVAKAEAYIERTIKGAKTYYRARFAGFDRDQAQSACKRLKRDDVECMALKM